MVDSLVESLSLMVCLMTVMAVMVCLMSVMDSLIMFYLTVGPPPFALDRPSSEDGLADGRPQARQGDYSLLWVNLEWIGLSRLRLMRVTDCVRPLFVEHWTAAFHHPLLLIALG